MEIKYISSEKITDQSSNKSSISEKNHLNKQQQKNKNENKLISQKPPIIVDRKLTMEPQIFRKEFVPILKPIEIHLVPSKLRLNKFIKKNRNYNNDLLSNSCPCSEDESELDCKLDSNSSYVSDSSNLSNDENSNINQTGLKEIRKKFIKVKNDLIHKVMTKKNLKNKKLTKQFKYFEKYYINEEEEEESEKSIKIYKDSDEESISSDLYDDNNNFINYSINQFENNNNKHLKVKHTKSSNVVNNSIKNYENIINDEKLEINDNNTNNEKRNRIYSFSILDTLKNKIKNNK